MVAPLRLAAQPSLTQRSRSSQLQHSANSLLKFVTLAFTTALKADPMIAFWPSALTPAGSGCSESGAYDKIPPTRVMELLVSLAVGIPVFACVKTRPVTVSTR